MNAPRCRLITQHRAGSQPNFQSPQIRPYPQEHRSQMHFLFNRAILKPGRPRRAYPAAASLGEHQVSRALANVLNIYCKENFSGRFAKSRHLFPSLSYPGPKAARSADGQPRPPPPCTPPPPASAGRTQAPAAAAQLGSLGARVRRASVTSPQPAGAPLGVSHVTRAACEVKKHPAPHLADPGPRFPRGLRGTLRTQRLRRPTGAQVSKCLDHVCKKAENSTVIILGCIFYL